MKIKRKIFGFISVVAIGSAFFTINAFAAEDIYEIKKGDTLWEISQKYKVDVWDVVDNNPQFPDPNLIYPEQKVIVPLSDSTPNRTSGTAASNAAPSKPAAVSPQNGNMPSLSASKPSNLNFEQQVMTLVNKERTSRGLKALTLSKDVSSAARYKSADMVSGGYFNHTSPTYGDPFTMLKNFGIKYTTAGENIAKGQKTPAAVVSAWMNSEGHRRNILNGSFTQIGVGYAMSSGGTAHWTQIFIKP